MSETLFPPTGLTLFEIQIKGSNYVKERHNSLHSSHVNNAFKITTRYYLIILITGYLINKSVYYLLNSLLTFALMITKGQYIKITHAYYGLLVKVVNH